VVVAGAVAQRPFLCGHAWVFVNWLLGLRSLGFDVLFLDRLEPDMLNDPSIPVERSREWRWLRSVMTRAGLGGRFALLFDRGRQCIGLPREEIVARLPAAIGLLNFMGYLDDEIVGRVSPRVFVDLDPGFTQMWAAQGLSTFLDGHNAFVTVGLGVGDPVSTVPTCGRRWVTTLPPVCLRSWPQRALPDLPAPRFTTVGTWRGPFAPISHDGVVYGLRVHEHRTFAGLPRHVPGAICEIALDISPADEADAAALRAGGWRLVPPAKVAGDNGSYQGYIGGSTAELATAKGMYVRTRAGWFSDRSACYLATGRPVVIQDTGISPSLPVGQGVLTFADVAGAIESVADVVGNPSVHAKAARDIAVEHLDARKVVRRVLLQTGVG
jgi:hypothetical protein